MTFKHVSQCSWFECLSVDGSDYVRLSAHNWGEWIGESLELVQNEQELAELEAAFQKALS